MAKVCVIQSGARHNYAIPVMLARRDMLGAFVTDFCIRGMNGWRGRAAARLSPAIARRTIPEEIIPWTKWIPGATFAKTIGMLCGEVFAYELEDRIIGYGALLSNVPRCDIVYAQFANGERFLRRAREGGAIIVNDVFITPVAHRIEEAERQSFPDWETPCFDPRRFERIEAKVRRMIELSDALFVPSETVLEGLRAYPGLNERRVVTVRYGCSLAFDQLSEPVPGRILFAGTACLRKGIHYLAKGGCLLGTPKPDLEILVAGQASPAVRNQPECQSLMFLGHLGKARMREEFARADVFVLPTLAEGTAGVVLEAMAAGVPVITTRAAGSPITDGVEGIIVPERDPYALAEAIERIVTDRELRASMSHNARRSAARHGLEQWGERLCAALRSLMSEEKDRQ